MVIDLEDNIWVFGWNKYRQLGIDNTEKKLTQTQIQGFKVKLITAGKTYIAFIDH